MQQLREAVGLESRDEYLLHDRDSIFSEYLDESMARLRAQGGSLFTEWHSSSRLF